MSENDRTAYEWHKVLEPDELDEGRVKTVAVGTIDLLAHVARCSGVMPLCG